MSKATCSIDDCEATVRARGLCPKHYTRHSLGRAMLDKPTFQTCQAPDCPAPPRSTHATYCERHYTRIRRNGSLNLKPTVLTVACANPTCDRNSQTSLGYCRRCRERVRRHGDPNVLIVKARSNRPGYSSAHRRIRQDRGPATLHTCPCGAPARHWAYDHTDPLELPSCYGPYSADPAHYLALCVRCHKRIDLDRLAAQR